MCLPAVYLMFGLSPIQATGWNWATHYLPFYIATLAVTWLQSGGFRLSAIVTSIAAAPVHVRALGGVLLGRKTKWTVTNGSSRSTSTIWPVMPHILFIALNVCAIFVGLSVMTHAAPTLLSVGWASLHVLFLGRVVLEAVRPAGRNDSSSSAPAVPLAPARPEWPLIDITETIDLSDIAAAAMGRQPELVSAGAVASVAAVASTPSTSHRARRSSRSIPEYAPSSPRSPLIAGRSLDDDRPDRHRRTQRPRRGSAERAAAR
jgi:cellulose synthase (UDP-forming)